MDADARPLPRWAESGSVLVAATSIALAVVLRLTPRVEPLLTVRFVFVCIGLAALVVAIGASCTGLLRGRVSVVVVPDRSLGRGLRQRIGRAAVGAVPVPTGRAVETRAAAELVVRQAPWMVVVFTAYVVLAAANLAQVSEGRDAWRWWFAAAAVMFAGVLLVALRHNRGALRVLARIELDRRAPAPGSAAAEQRRDDVAEA